MHFLFVLKNAVFQCKKLCRYKSINFQTHIFKHLYFCIILLCIIIFNVQIIFHLMLLDIL